MAQTMSVRAFRPELDPRPDRLVNQIVNAGVWRPDVGQWQVSAQSSPNMTVRVGSGTAFDLAVVAGGAAGQGSYFVENQDPYVGSGNADLPIANGDASNPRRDLIVLRVYDDELDSSGLTLARVEVVQGTPAASPATPATPSGAVALGYVQVPAGESTSIVAGYITDLRPRALLRSGLLNGISLVEPSVSGNPATKNYVDTTAVRWSQLAQSSQDATDRPITSTSYVGVSGGVSTTVTVGASGLLKVTLSADIDNTANRAYFGFELSGANTLVADDGRAAMVSGARAFFSRTILLTGLSAGSTTLSARYRVAGGTGTFRLSRILAEPLG